MNIVTCAILRNEQDAVLLCRRAPGQNHAGRWEFPGGKQEPGETLAQCLVREMQEELALEVTVSAEICQTIYHYPGGSIQLIAFSCQCTNAQPQLQVHDSFAWVPPFQLLDYDLTEADIPIAQVLIAYSSANSAH